MSADLHAAAGDHVGTEGGVGAAVGGFGIGDVVVGVVDAGDIVIAGFSGPATVRVLTVPVKVVSGPEDECDVPTLSGGEWGGEVGRGDEAIGDGACED